MNDSHQYFVDICQWDTASYLIFSNNVFANLIYYSHLLPMVISLMLGGLILFQGKKDLSIRFLFTLIITISLWIFSDLVLWAHSKPSYIMFFWSVTILLEPIVYALSLFFLYTFINKKEPPISIQIPVLIMLLPTIFFTPTQFGIVNFDLSNCYREVTEGWLVYYGYIIEIIISIWILTYGVYSFFKNKNTEDKKQIFLITLSLTLFLLAFASGNIVGSLSENWTMGQYGLFGVPIFIGLIAYLIVKYHTFNIKLLSTQALISSIWVFTLGILFLRKISTVRIVVSITLILFTVLGYMIIKSVKHEIKQREKIQKLADDLERANEQKSEFMSFASHQIRTPVTVMKGYAANILEGDAGPITPELKDSVQKILVSGNNVVALIGDYLDKSKIELGQLKYNFKPTDLKELTHKVVEQMRPNIEQAKLSISFNAEEGKNYISNIDPGKIVQVIGNLIDNAIKYTPSGSVSVSIQNIAGKVRIKISDTGVGMEKETISDLFQKFNRAKDAGDTNMLGTGLGLFLAKMMVDGHKGRIWAESEGKGKGSQFFIELSDY